MSSYATSSKVDENSNIRHRNVDHEREKVLNIIESAERRRPHLHHALREIWEVIAVILLVIASHILLGLMSWIIFTILDFVISWGNFILGWIHSLVTLKWL